MSSSEKTSIAPAPDGPYIVKGLKSLANQNGVVECKETMALCRCGGSANKPFCDGTHRKIGFSSVPVEGRLEDKQDHYRGKRLTIHDNRSLCAHAGVCTDNLASVFRMKQEPWIDPDAATVEEILAVVRRCPSGALSCTVDEVEVAGGDGGPAIRIAPNGPYIVAGDVELVDGQWGEGACREQFALCRCGASKNKPFCDGSHWSIGFVDETN